MNAASPCMDLGTLFSLSMVSLESGKVFETRPPQEHLLARLPLRIHATNYPRITRSPVTRAAARESRTLGVAPRPRTLDGTSAT